MSTTAPQHAKPSEHDPMVQRNGRFFYGWVIVAVTFVAQFLTMGQVFYTFGVILATGMALTGPMPNNALPA